MTDLLTPEWATIWTHNYHPTGELKAEATQCENCEQWTLTGYPYRQYPKYDKPQFNPNPLTTQLISAALILKLETAHIATLDLETQTATFTENREIKGTTISEHHCHLPPLSNLPLPVNDNTHTYHDNCECPPPF